MLISHHNFSFKTGIIPFGPGAKLANRFKDKKYQKTVKLNKLVNKYMKRQARRWGTRIDMAQKEALEKLFIPKDGDRPDAKNIMIIITDGKPTGQRKPDFTPFKQLTEALEVR